MFGDLMGKLQDAQKQMEETKKRLDSVFVEAEAEGGLVKVKANANRKIVNISISQQLVDEKDKDALEDLVLTAVNRALEQAEKVNESEMQNVAMGMMPNIPGIF